MPLLSPLQFPISGFSRLERAAWHTLPLSVQETILASQEAEDPATLELGPTRLVSIAEVFVWTKLHKPMFVTRVVERLNPDGCVILNANYGGVVTKVYKRILDLGRDTKKKFDSSLNTYVTESLVAFFERDALFWTTYGLPFSFDIMKKTQLLGASTTTSSSDGTSVAPSCKADAFDNKVTPSPS